MRLGRFLAASVAVLLTTCGATGFGSETPPEGPPWKRDFLDAQRQGLKQGKPIFLYFTKTH